MREPFLIEYAGRIGEGMRIPCVCDGQVLCFAGGCCNPASVKKPCNLRGFRRFLVDLTVARSARPAGRFRGKTLKTPYFRVFSWPRRPNQPSSDAKKRFPERSEKRQNHRGFFPPESPKKPRFTAFGGRIGRRWRDLNWTIPRLKLAPGPLLQRPQNRCPPPQ